MKINALFLKLPFLLKLLPFLILSILFSSEIYAQEFSRADSLRGALNPMRACFDVLHYDISLRIAPDEKHISGSNTILFEAKAPSKKIQLDFFPEMNISSIRLGEKTLRFEREAAAVFIELPEILTKENQYRLHIDFNGKPRIAPNPPWDGGFTWKKDKKGRHWIGLSCEGLGASVWLPHKDHLSDEPDSIRLSCTVPEGLTCISNGTLIQTETHQGESTFVWETKNPINNYNISLNIAHYTHIADTLRMENGDILDLDYYVLDYNTDKAEKHFRQVKPMLTIYEELFGSYPFPEDGFALVETPFWGMEHQGAIAYGNNFINNAFKFDFIIIHESGHEYFGNSISVKDHAEMWIHEAFTTYAEALFLEKRDGLEKAEDYLMTQKQRIGNRSPMLAPLDVNYKDWEDSDIYYKGTWMLHTFRNAIADDKKWFAAIKAFCEHFRHRHADTGEVIAFFSKAVNKDMKPWFYEYLTTTEYPTLEYEWKPHRKGSYRLHYRWISKNSDFNMPVKVTIDNSEVLLSPTGTMQTLKKNFRKIQAIDINPKHFLIHLQGKQSSK